VTLVACLLAGIAVGYFLPWGPRRRPPPCDVLAPLEAEVGMFGCERPAGHPPPHRRDGAEWT
jgi:hypothetical protein